MSNAKGMVLQERDRHLLHELALMRVIDREQAKVVAGFGSTTRANTRLLALTRAELLRRFFLGTRAGGAKALYALSPKGAFVARVPYRRLRRSTEEAVVGDGFVEHQLAINEVFCGLKYGAPPPGVSFRRWGTFEEPIAGLRLIPDGYAEFATPEGTVAAFLELDLGHERLKVLQEKAEHYLEFAQSGAFTREFRERRFRTLVVAHSEKRTQSIREAIVPLTEKLFWFSDLPAIRREGAFASVWLRPRSEKPQLLFRGTP